jgi:hypothetical protein
MEENTKNSNLKENIKKLLENLKKYEKKKDDPSYIEWINKITEPKYFFISDIINYFLDQLTTRELKEQVLFLLRKLYEFKKENVAPQLIYNKEFIKGLINYVNHNNKKDTLSESSFYILSELYYEENFQNYINEDYISTLFYGLKYVHDNILLNEIIDVLLEINTKSYAKEINLFLEVYMVHPCSRILSEIFLRVVNVEENKKRLGKILICLNDLMDNEKSCIFCNSDIKIFIDILISQLQSNTSTELTIILLNTLERLTIYEEYYDCLYKVDDITELMEDFEGSIEQNTEVRRISKQIVINITDHQGKHNNLN